MLDIQLRNIQNLKWLPFIGEDFLDSEYKVLFIGESHYVNPSDINKNSYDERFTRWITDELGIGNRDYEDKTNFFKVLNKMFVKNDSSEFWSQIAFYNFIQRPMKKNDLINERPKANS